MGFYVQIQKKSSDGKTSNYVFFNENGSGEFSVNEQSGKIDYYCKMPNDVKNVYFSRAAFKVIKHWQTSGKLPDAELWAS
ncbi:hypothetical protein [Enterobacter hormaechei]|uniref:hypothetical protein n=1 Tax=Enterobacter hormaechei TaxID=158836 RepID=UPI0007979542|nr:hypothetical protein [Enterobacter hormaechei]AOP82305.1 hypothetical protein BFV66_09855 [Enterobacter hormaechei subsp. oharae]UBH33922.1 hypothetical protein LA353_11330 [Enterobacter hormaechei subsp. oharae]SAC30654.1 Uncharacterised protein [Enterobacter hormaechei]HAS0867601.1 hypothetical protein [Enterobacter hormaechei subsp. oharae]